MEEGEEGRGKNQKQFISVISGKVNQISCCCVNPMLSLPAVSCCSSGPADQTVPPNKTASDIEFTFVV